MFIKYRNAGLCVTPLKAGIPVVKWGQYTENLPTYEEVTSWEQYNEYSLVCGKVSNVIALDIDIEDTKIIESLAGISPVKKFGSKGITSFYTYNGEKSTNWKSNGTVVCELLSDKRLTTLPPSPHRKNGKPYVWRGNELGTIDLPSINQDIFLYLDAKYPKPVYHFKPIASLNESVDLTEAESMLDFVSSDCSRDEWLQIGMALRDEFGDMAYNLWHTWSAKSSKYKQKDADSVWKSFSGEGVTIATVVFYAKQGGWLRERKDEGYSVDISYIFKKKAAILTAHGLVGEIAEWMTRTAWRPQPLLAIGAALVFVGFLKGRKYITQTDVYSNIYAFNIAGSACGKDRPQAAIGHILRQIKKDDKLLNKPASATGFIDSLLSVSGHGLTVIDEMADYIASTNNKNSGHKALVLSNWIQSFTSCTGHLDGERRADAAKEKVKRVYNPHFCLLGSTNPISLKEALSGGDISNGLLNRFLFFQSNESPRKRKFKEFDLNEQLPESTLNRISSYLDGISNIYGNQAGLIKVPFTDEAMELSDIIADYYEDECQKLDINNRLRFLYGRAHEYMVKIALILCDDERITKTDIECANQIVLFSVANALKFCEEISDTREEKDFIAVRDFIRSRGRATFGEVTYAVRSVKSQRAGEIITSLSDNSFVRIETESTKGRPAKVIIWQN